MPQHKMRPDDVETPNEVDKESLKRPDDRKKSPNVDTGLANAELPPPGGDPWHDGP